MTASTTAPIPMYSTTLLDDGEESPFALEEADGDSEPALEDEVVAVVPDFGDGVLCSSSPHISGRF